MLKCYVRIFRNTYLLMQKIAYIIIFILIIYFVDCSASSFAQGLTSEQFDVVLQACAQSKNIPFGPTLAKEVHDLFVDPNQKASIGNIGEFLLKIPETDRPGAYRLYGGCISDLIPFLKPESEQVILQPPPPLQPPAALQLPSVTYKVCSGEYERACPAHDAYLYCGSDVKNWSDSKCSSSTVSRINTYGGNKCGYALDLVVCIGPKP